jgi:hypothetical protein
MIPIKTGIEKSVEWQRADDHAVMLDPLSPGNLL